MDNKVKQSLDRYLTTPPEEPEEDYSYPRIKIDREENGWWHISIQFHEMLGVSCTYETLDEALAFLKEKVKS